MVLFATMILLITEPYASLNDIIFEITSAFGTCGMSQGITSNLSSAGKIVVMILMFIGRVGLISFLYSLGGKAKKSQYRYPKERVIIGNRLEICKDLHKNLLDVEGLVFSMVKSLNDQAAKRLNLKEYDFITMDEPSKRAWEKLLKGFPNEAYAYCTLNVKVGEQFEKLVE
ncbi:TrkH-domain-containing protein [Rhizophagus irregularis]|uniref:TrkH-domain-containing protein n=1 Tax=Rhizophagus irregularis TaxID=588596 RepID=A0A2N0QMU5_9GLOM|nr:TrkH-domain-containing protein [Rhizophagus irregularis]